MQNQTIFELYTDDDKSKYSSNPKDILKSAKKIKKNKIKLYKKKINKKLKKFYTKRTFTAPTTEFVWKIPNRKKMSFIKRLKYHFNLCEAETSLDGIIKFINYET